MPKVVTFNKMQIENVVLFKKDGVWALGANVTLQSETGGGNLGQNVLMQLDEAQQLKVRKFLQPFIQQVRDGLDIQDVVNFEDPPEPE